MQCCFNSPAIILQCTSLSLSNRTFAINISGSDHWFITYRFESFPLRVTGWPVELMAYAFLVVSPPEMSQRFEEVCHFCFAPIFRDLVDWGKTRGLLKINWAYTYSIWVISQSLSFQMAVAASNKSPSKPGLNYPELEEQALQFILDCCESNIAKYTKFLEVRSFPWKILQNF